MFGLGAVFCWSLSSGASIPFFATCPKKMPKDQQNLRPFPSVRVVSFRTTPPFYLPSLSPEFSEQLVLSWVLGQVTVVRRSGVVMG